MKEAPHPPIPYVVKVATMTKALRNLYGMSQTELAKASGLSRPTISKLEKLSGELNTRSDTLEQLLNVFRELGVEIDINTDDVILRIPNDALAKALKDAVDSVEEGKE
jgi:transcriptional regulator with XRE-family HTH domain